MKAIVKVCAFVLAALVLTACGALNKDISATVDGEPVYRWEVELLYRQNKGAIESTQDVEDLDAPEFFMEKRQVLTNYLERAIENKIIYLEAVKKGHALTEADQAAVTAAFETAKENSIQFFMASEFAGQADARQLAEERYGRYLADLGITEEQMQQAMAQEKVMQPLIDELMGDLEANQEENLRQQYEKGLEEQKKNFADSPGTFESLAGKSSDALMYIPYATKRVVLFKVPYPDDVQEQLDASLAEYEELNTQISSIMGGGAGDLNAVYDALAQCNERIVQADLDGTEQSAELAAQIGAEINSDNFIRLLDQYGEGDPMALYDAKQFGALVSSESGYPQALYEAAMKLKTPGDVSPPVETQAGWYILQLLEDLPRGEVPFEKASVYLRTMNQGQAQVSFIMQYAESIKKGHNIRRNLEKLR